MIQRIDTTERRSRFCALVVTAALATVLASAPASAQSSRSRNDNSPFAGFSGDSNEPVRVKSRTIELRQNEKKAIFMGGVVASQGESVLKAPTVTVFYETARGGEQSGFSAGGGAVRRIVATGGVRINTGDQWATGSRGVFDMKANRAMLYGNVVMVQGPNVVRGKTLTVNLKTGLAVVGGGTEARLVPNDDKQAGGATGQRKRRF